MAFTGRRVIYTDATEITEANLISVIRDSLDVHEANRTEIEYLYNYFRGRQPILDKKKLVTPEINNKVLVNRAMEIVNFKVGYLLGEPMQYVGRNESNKDESIFALNDCVFNQDKASKDKELAEWFNICGTSYRLILPNEDKEEVASIYTLDPRNTFVVYTNDVEHKPILGVTYVYNKEHQRQFTCYTRDKVYYLGEIRNSRDKKDKMVLKPTENNFMKAIPIVEYPANSSRIGAFEPVLSLLDAINQVTSDRADAVDGFVQALMVFKGVDISNDDYKALKDEGAIRVPVDGDIKYLVQELNQGETQTLIDDMYNTVLSIVGMPSTSDGNTSDSSNNGAVILKNGWQGAESLAKASEVLMKKSEKMFLKILCDIARTYKQFDVAPKDIDIRFTRRNYENILSKSQTLITMLNSGKIHPKLAFEYSGMFTDPELAYKMSEEYISEQSEKEQEELEQFRQTTRISVSENESEDTDNVN